MRWKVVLVITILATLFLPADLLGEKNIVGYGEKAVMGFLMGCTVVVVLPFRSKCSYCRGKEIIGGVTVRKNVQKKAVAKKSTHLVTMLIKVQEK